MAEADGSSALPILHLASTTYRIATGPQAARHGFPIPILDPGNHSSRAETVRWIGNPVDRLRARGRHAVAPAPSAQSWFQVKMAGEPPVCTKTTTSSFAKRPSRTCATMPEAALPV